MSTRSRFIACASLAALVSAPAIVAAQASQVVNVAYENAPLSRIAAGFASFAGRAIVVDSAVGDPTVTASVQGLDWQVGLDAILADHALIARPAMGGGLRVEREQRITVAYEGARLSAVVAQFAAFAKRTIELPSAAADIEVSTAIADTDWQRALEEILHQSGYTARWDGDGVVRAVPRSR
jgi:hypothetical protein